MKPILFVEDDDLIATGLIYALEGEGYRVDHCRDLASARAVAARDFSLGLLDLSLPDGTSYGLCAELRDRGVPVIFLTAVDDEGNVVRGLEMGADDYIVKPFRLRELMARIAGVLRRSEGAGESKAVLPVAPGLHIHTLEGKAYREGAPLDLTALEYRLLLTLAQHRGQVLTRTQLLEGIWDSAGNFVSDNALTVYIKRLREKIGDDPGAPQIIETVRGMGYKLHG